MKRAITGIVAAGLALGMMAPAAFAATTSSSTLSAAGGKSITVDGSTLYTGVQAGTATDAGTTTTYFPIWYLEQALTKAGYTNQYDPSTKTWNIQIPGVNAANVNVDGGVGTGNAAIAINGIVVKKFNAEWHKDFAGGANAAVTTYFPIYYLGNVLSAAGFTNAWNGSSFGFQSAYGQASAVKLSAASSSIIANNGVATDAITATVVDANGNVVRDFNGTANLSVVGSGILLPNGTNADTVTFTNGVGTFNVTSNTTTPGVASTVDVYGLTTSNGSSMATNMSYTPVTITTAAATASQIGLSFDPNAATSLSANSSTGTQLSLSVEDASGDAYTGSGQYVTLNISGPGSFSQSSTVTTETLFVDGTYTAPINVYSVQGESGVISVSASASGLTSPSPVQIPVYVNTAASSLSLAGTTGTDSNGNTYTLYTVKLLDTNGNPITTSAAADASDAISITNNSSVQGGSLKFGTVNSAGVFTATGSVPTNLTDGMATFAVETDAVGTNPVTFTVTDPTLDVSATAPYSFTAGVPTTVSVSPAAGGNDYALTAGQSVTYTAQLSDGTNSVAEAGQTVEFNINSNTAGALFANGQSGTYYATTNANGVASVTVNVPSTATQGETFQVAAALSGTTPVNGAVTKVVDAASYATGVSVSNVPSTPATAGSGAISGITAEATNAVGSPVSGDTLEITSSNDAVVSVGGAGNSSETITSTNGSVALSGLAAGEAGTATITVQDISNPSQPETTFNLTVVPGTATTGAIEFNGQAISASNPLNVTANTYTALTVSNVDAAGDPVPVTTTQAGGNTYVTYYLHDSNGGAFSTTPGGAPVTSVEIPVGQTSVTVYYVNGSTESITGGLTADGNAVVLAAPTVTNPSAGELDITGMEPGATVTVTGANGTTVWGSGTANYNGDFTYYYGSNPNATSTSSQVQSGWALTVTQTVSGTTSAGTTVTVK